MLKWARQVSLRHFPLLAKIAVACLRFAMVNGSLSGPTIDATSPGKCPTGPRILHCLSCDACLSAGQLLAFHADVQALLLISVGLVQ
jgi:hypothetical protein